MITEKSKPSELDTDGNGSPMTIEIQNPEEQKMSDKLRKERLLLIYKTANGLVDLLNRFTGGSRSSTTLLNLHNLINGHEKTHLDKLHKLIDIGAELGFINKEDFLATTLADAKKNLGNLISTISKQLLPELHIKELSGKIDAVGIIK